MSFTLTCYQCFAAVSWCHWKSSSIVASSLPCALSLLPNAPAISGSVHSHYIVLLKFLAPKNLCHTMENTVPWLPWTQQTTAVNRNAAILLCSNFDYSGSHFH